MIVRSRIASAKGLLGSAVAKQSRHQSLPLAQALCHHLEVITLLPLTLRLLLLLLVSSLSRKTLCQWM
jgi:hypothetical protein